MRFNDKQGQNLIIITQPFRTCYRSYTTALLPSYITAEVSVYNTSVNRLSSRGRFIFKVKWLVRFEG